MELLVVFVVFFILGRLGLGRIVGALAVAAVVTAIVAAVVYAVS